MVSGAPLKATVHAPSEREGGQVDTLQPEHESPPSSGLTQHTTKVHDSLDKLELMEEITSLEKNKDLENHNQEAIEDLKRAILEASCTFEALEDSMKTTSLEPKMKETAAQCNEAVQAAHISFVQSEIAFAQLNYVKEKARVAVMEVEDMAEHEKQLQCLYAAEAEILERKYQLLKKRAEEQEEYKKDKEAMYADSGMQIEFLEEDIQRADERRFAAEEEEEKIYEEMRATYIPPEYIKNNENYDEKLWLLAVEQYGEWADIMMMPTKNSDIVHKNSLAELDELTKEMQERTDQKTAKRLEAAAEKLEETLQPLVEEETQMKEEHKNAFQVVRRDSEAKMEQAEIDKRRQMRKAIKKHKKSIGSLKKAKGNVDHWEQAAAQCEQQTQRCRAQSIEIEGDLEVKRRETAQVGDQIQETLGSLKEVQDKWAELYKYKKPQVPTPEAAAKTALYDRELAQLRLKLARWRSLHECILGKVHAENEDELNQLRFERQQQARDLYERRKSKMLCMKEEFRQQMDEQDQELQAMSQLCAMNEEILEKQLRQLQQTGPTEPVDWSEKSRDVYAWRNPQVWESQQTGLTEPMYWTEDAQDVYYWLNPQVWQSEQTGPTEPLDLTEDSQEVHALPNPQVWQSEQTGPTEALELTENSQEVHALPNPQVLESEQTGPTEPLDLTEDSQDVYAWPDSQVLESEQTEPTEPVDWAEESRKVYAWLNQQVLESQQTGATEPEDRTENSQEVFYWLNLEAQQRLARTQQSLDARTQELEEKPKQRIMNLVTQEISQAEARLQDLQRENAQLQMQLTDLDASRGEKNTAAQGEEGNQEDGRTEDELKEEDRTNACSSANLQ